MARRWEGFLAQNQELKEQWEVLEESREQIEARLQGLPVQEDEDDNERDEKKRQFLR